MIIDCRVVLPWLLSRPKGAHRNKVRSRIRYYARNSNKGFRYFTTEYEHWIPEIIDGELDYHYGGVSYKGGAIYVKIPPRWKRKLPSKGYYKWRLPNENI